MAYHSNLMLIRDICKLRASIEVAKWRSRSGLIMQMVIFHTQMALDELLKSFQLFTHLPAPLIKHTFEFLVYHELQAIPLVNRAFRLYVPIRTDPTAGELQEGILVELGPRLPYDSLLLKQAFVCADSPEKLTMYRLTENQVRKYSYIYANGSWSSQDAVHDTVIWNGLSSLSPKHKEHVVRMDFNSTYAVMELQDKPDKDKSSLLWWDLRCSSSAQPFQRVSKLFDTWELQSSILYQYNFETGEGESNFEVIYLDLSCPFVERNINWKKVYLESSFDYETRLLWRTYHLYFLSDGEITRQSYILHKPFSPETIYGTSQKKQIRRKQKSEQNIVQDFIVSESEEYFVCSCLLSTRTEAWLYVFAMQSDPPLLYSFRVDSEPITMYGLGSSKSFLCW